jgi:hypothetical protein
MRIRMLRNLGREFPPFRVGEEHDVDDQLGEALCNRSLAERIQAVPPAPIKGVPPEPGSVEKATEDLVSRKERAKKPDA